MTLLAAENDPILSGRSASGSSSASTFRFDMPVCIFRNRHDVGDGLPPGQVIAVVLERADEDNRALLRRNVLAEVVPAVEVGGQAEVEDGKESVDGTGGAGAGEDDRHLAGIGAQAAADDVARVPAQPGRLQAGARRFGVVFARSAATPRRR